MSETAATRTDYPHLLAIPTRWNDNDVYGHVNNVEYYGFFDTVINHWLITRGRARHPRRRSSRSASARSRIAATARRSASRTPIEAGLRVGKLGNSSVRYEIGIFRQGEEEAGAEGWFVHVFVDAATREPVSIPDGIRAALERLQAGGTG